MNRLWVGISLVIGLVVVFVAVFPIAMRRLDVSSEQRPPPPPALTSEQAARMQAEMENRERERWTSLMRTLLAGAVVGLGAGILFSRWLAAPLGHLELGARAVADGRLDIRLPVQGSREIRSAAAAFNQMAADLEKAETLRRNLLADVTHELRHPVHVLQGNLQAILDGVYPLTLEEIAGLFDQTRHLSTLVDDLHELAQAEAHQLHLQRQETDLAALAGNVVEAFQPLAAAQEISLQVQLPAGPLVRSLDPERMRQALQNLLVNALRHTSAGGQIMVTVSEQGQQALVQVQDDGVGILPEHLPHVFDRFYRADPSRSRQQGGSGLGLAITQAIVRAHGGEVEAGSAGKDQGSTFIIRLP